MASQILKSIKKASAKKSKNKEVKLIIGSVYSKISGDIPIRLLNRIDHSLSYWVPGAQFSKPFRAKVWDGRIHFFSRKSKIFPTGFIKDVKSFLKKAKIKVLVKDKRNLKKIEKNQILKASKKLKNFKFRKYQIIAAKKAINSGMGIINIPTGTGKTAIINLILFGLDIVYGRKSKYLILASGSSLLRQHQKVLEKFHDEEIGFIGESEFNIKRITVGSIDTLYPILTFKSLKKKNKKAILTKRKQKVKLSSYLEKCRGVFPDEAHHFPAQTFKTVLKHCKAPIRIGTTATYTRSDGSSMQLKAVTGKIIYKKTTSEMIEEGWLAKPTIFLFEFEGDEKEKERIERLYSKYKNKKESPFTKEWQKIYSVEVALNKRRNLLIEKITKALYSFGLSSLIFVREIEHGNTLLKDLTKAKFSIPKDEISFLSGTDSSKKRETITKAFQTGQLRTLICSNIFSEGIDLPEANAGIKASGLRYGGSVVQQLGRILRKVKSPLAKDINPEEKQIVFWVDICDLHHPILAEHSLERIKIYESEPAFDVIYVTSIKEMKQLIKDKIGDVKIVSKNRKGVNR